MRWLQRAAFGLALAGSASGCAEDGAAPPYTGARKSALRAHGWVKYQGQLLGGGTVRIVSLEDPTASVSTGIDANGNYSVENIPLGKVRILVETETAKTFDPKYRKGPAAEPPPGVNIPTLRYVQIPLEYGVPNSPFVDDFETPDNEVNLDLK